MVMNNFSHFLYFNVFSKIFLMDYVLLLEPGKIKC